MNREENFINKLNEVNPNIIYIDGYKTVRNKVKCKCKIDGTEWESYPSNLLNKSAGCPQCRRPSQTKPQSREQFIAKLKKIHPHIIMISEYVNARTPSKFKCDICNHTWSARPYNFISGYGCPSCSSTSAGLKRRTKNKREQVERLNPNIEFLYVPERTVDKCKCKCKICGNVWQTNFHNLTNPCNHTGCPRCKSSAGEKRIELILIKLGVEYEKQKRFADCKDIQELPFDFFLSKHNIAIEFDGRQHYELVPWTKNAQTNEDEFKKTKRHDFIKTQYCEKNNITLIRIPYWEKDNIESLIKERVI